MKRDHLQKTLVPIALLMSMLCWLPAALAADNCDKAEALFLNASKESDPAAQGALLEEAVQQCPTHAKAWNNLGTVYEKQKRLTAARNAYEKSHQGDPELGTPLAGLGDVAMKMGRFEEASKWYAQFLAFLQEEKLRGNPRGLGIFEGEYQAKYERVQLKQQILADSMAGVVPKEVLKRGLRPISPVDSVKEDLEAERLSLFVYFDFNSAELKAQGRAQLAELAATMLLPEYQEQAFLIEGHSDLFGEQDYNHNLSARRAKEVRDFLSASGVDPKRLQTKGLGETRPLVLEGDRQAQQINRRVEFVQLGVVQ
ncbi:MAG: OmpA family protein [Desulfosarcinaceae bacterium]|nr:OmpA family protein [Desulfosarcinaceae bacterium]